MDETFEGVAFPYDGAPLVILGTGLEDSYSSEVVPTLFTADGDEVPVTRSRTTRADGSGAADWIRLRPVEPLERSARYLLRLVLEADGVDPDGREDEQRDLDRRMGTAEFVTGESLWDREPQPIDFETRLVETPGGVSGPDPCGSVGGVYSGSTRLSVRSIDAAAPEQAYDRWRFFIVGDGDVDPAVDDHWGASDAERTMREGYDSTESLLARNVVGDDADRVCVGVATEDAYGRTSELSELQCVERVPSCIADCSVAGSERGSLLWLLLLAMRRRRA